MKQIKLRINENITSVKILRFSKLVKFEYLLLKIRIILNVIVPAIKKKTASPHKI